MTKPQIITTESGEELVVLPRRVYDELVAAQANEDAATARVVDHALAALAAGDEVALPAAVAEAIARGGNPIRVVRDWRGLTQAQLGQVTKLGQSYISQLEGGTRIGRLPVLKTIAQALGVPLDLLTED